MLAFVRQLYFWMFLLMNIILLGVIIIMPDFVEWNFFDYVSLIFMPLGLVALYGYAYDKLIFEQWFWRIVVIMILLSDVAYGLIYFIQALLSNEDTSQIALSGWVYPIAAMLVFVPYWIGISRYSFSKQRW